MSEELHPDQYRQILESLPHGLYIIDTNRCIRFWNAGAERITGYLPQEVIGRRCPDTPLRHCDENFANLCDLGCPVDDTVRDGHPREANLYLCHRNGHHVPIHMWVVPIRNEHGIIIGAAETFDEGHRSADAPAPSPSASSSHRPYGLTGVGDAASVRAFLEKALEAFEQRETPVGVLQIALDAFAEFRKAHGGPAAERIAQSVAEALSHSMAKQDVIGQWDEDQFLAVLVDCPPVMLASAADRLRHVAQAVAISWWGDRLSVSLSVGGTAARTGDTVESLLGRTGRALRACLQSGNGVEIS